MGKIDGSEIICPVCGYYCLGKGGMGCIDKPTMVGDSNRAILKAYIQEYFPDLAKQLAPMSYQRALAILNEYTGLTECGSTLIETSCPRFLEKLKEMKAHADEN